MDYSVFLRKGRLRNTTYVTGEDFFRDAIAYFKWAEDNPHFEEKVAFHQGEVCRADVTKIRAFTKTGLANHLGIPLNRLSSYAKRETGTFAQVMVLIDQIIYEQKFSAAAAGLLNTNIIVRDLGLADKQEVGGIEGGAPVAVVINPIAQGTFLPVEPTPT